MRRLAAVLLSAAALAVPSLVLATPALAADPLEPVRVVKVYVTADGDVCVVYRNLTTVCTNT